MRSIGRVVLVAVSLALPACSVGAVYRRELAERRQEVGKLHLPPAAQALVRRACVEAANNGPNDPGCLSAELAALSLTSIQRQLVAAPEGLLQRSQELAAAAIARAQLNQRVWQLTINQPAADETQQSVHYDADDMLDLVTQLSRVLGVQQRMQQMSDGLVEQVKDETIRSSRALVVEVCILTELALNPYGSAASYGAAINDAQRALARAEIERRIDDGALPGTRSPAVAP